MNAHDPFPFASEGPRPLVRQIPEGQPYPVEALGPLRSAVEAAQAAKQAPVALAAQSALSVASLAVQGHADVQTLGNAHVPVSLYCMSIAKSGERKSATDKLLMAGLREYERQANQEYREEVVAHATSLDLYKQDRDVILGEIKKAKGPQKTAKRADLGALGAEPEPPLKRLLTATEPTLEGLHRLFMEGQPALGVFSDEGGGFLGGHGMSKENRLRTIAGLSDLWGGEPIRRVRAGDGSCAMYGRRLAMHLMVQPVAAQEVLADPLAVGQGFLARFLITQPRSAIGTRLARARIAQPTLDAFAARLSCLLEKERPIAEGDRQELQPRVLPLSSQAEELLWQYYEVTEKEQAPGGDLENCTSFASKSAEQACRIAAVMTLWQDLQAAEVTAEAMKDGISLAQYYLTEARRLADGAIISKETDRAEKLRLWMLSNWPHDDITPSEVLRNAPHRDLRESPAARAAIGVLERHGWLVPLSPMTLVRGVTRKEAWRIVRHASSA